MAARSHAPDGALLAVGGGGRREGEMGDEWLETLRGDATGEAMIDVGEEVGAGLPVGSMGGRCGAAVAVS